MIWGCVALGDQKFCRLVFAGHFDTLILGFFQLQPLQCLRLTGQIDRLSILTLRAGLTHSNKRRVRGAEHVVTM